MRTMVAAKDMQAKGEFMKIVGFELEDWDLSVKALMQFKGLKLIATRSTGFDYIDIE